MKPLEKAIHSLVLMTRWLRTVPGIGVGTTRSVQARELGRDLAHTGFTTTLRNGDDGFVSVEVLHRSERYVVSIDLSVKVVPGVSAVSILDFLGGSATDVRPHDFLKAVAFWAARGHLEKVIEWSGPEIGSCVMTGEGETCSLGHSEFLAKTAMRTYLINNGSPSSVAGFSARVLTAGVCGNSVAFVVYDAIDKSDYEVWVHLGIPSETPKVEICKRNTVKRMKPWVPCRAILDGPAYGHPVFWSVLEHLEERIQGRMSAGGFLSGQMSWLKVQEVMGSVVKNEPLLHPAVQKDVAVAIGATKGLPSGWRVRVLHRSEKCFELFVEEPSKKKFVVRLTLMKNGWKISRFRLSEFDWTLGEWWSCWTGNESNLRDTPFWAAFEYVSIVVGKTLMAIPKPAAKTPVVESVEKVSSMSGMGTCLGDNIVTPHFSVLRVRFSDFVPSSPSSITKVFQVLATSVQRTIGSNKPSMELRSVGMIQDGSASVPSMSVKPLPEVIRKEVVEAVGKYIQI